PLPPLPPLPLSSPSLYTSLHSLSPLSSPLSPLSLPHSLSPTLAVENPTHQEIRDVLSSAGLKIGVENKYYCRERSKEMLYRGRIRVQLKNDDGTPFNPDLPTRDSIMLYLGQMIPKLKSRSGKQSAADTNQAQSSGGAKKKSKGRR
ncbi:signal recognition particle 19 kDa protein, partial [Schistocerca gregaria]|uniref:signal recognition particle 19 kDa protein n=1 Tax=Schistocerca gregaria TaxID=7010 RepID=UPI00211E7AE8